jgi:hypothetical protein
MRALIIVSFQKVIVPKTEDDFIKNGIFRIAKEQINNSSNHFSDTGNAYLGILLVLDQGYSYCSASPITPEQYKEMSMEELRDSAHDIVESELPYKKQKK